MKLDRLDFKKLLAFQLVARQGSLRLAARRLNQTVPAVSAKLRKLEEDLDVALFERLPNRLILTDLGIKFLAEVDIVMEQADHALKTVTSGSELVGRLSVSIGSDHSWFVAPRISRFLKRCPGADLSLQVYRSVDAIEALNRGNLNLAIGVFPPLPDTLQSEQLIETTLSLVCPVGHPLLNRRPPRLEDLRGNRLIVLPSHAETRKIVNRAMSRSGMADSDMIEVANCETAVDFVRRGVGIALAHTLCAGQARHAQEIESVDLGRRVGAIGFSAVYRRNSSHSPLMANLLDELRGPETRGGTLPL